MATKRLFWATKRVIVLLFVLALKERFELSGTESGRGFANPWWGLLYRTGSFRRGSRTWFWTSLLPYFASPTLFGLPELQSFRQSKVG